MATPSKARLSKAERTKESILTAAERSFSENGFDATTLDFIGERAGIQGTAILYHYATKRELYEAVLDRMFTPLVDEVDLLVSGHGPLEERLLAVTSTMVRFASKQPGAARLLLREASAGSADVKDIVGSATERHWKRLLEALNAEQSGDMDGDPMIFWNIIVGAICFYFAAGPTVGGLSYDPSDPLRTAAFEDVMMNLTATLVASRTKSSHSA